MEEKGGGRAAPGQERGGSEEGLCLGCCLPLLASRGSAGSELALTGGNLPYPALPQVQNGTLLIQRVQRGSSGVYTCQASSTEGSATHATQLLVLGAVCKDSCVGGWGTCDGGGTRQV